MYYIRGIVIYFISMYEMANHYTQNLMKWNILVLEEKILKSILLVLVRDAEKKSF
jgi:hypothetical protein